MSTTVITTSIAIATFILTMVTQIIRLTVKITTLENGATQMDKELCKVIQAQEKELENTRQTLQEHEKLITVLTTQMTDIKDDLHTINSKLDRLLLDKTSNPKKRQVR